MRRIGVVRTQDRWIGGVAGGLARRFGVDPILVRGILFVTALLAGVGFVLYGLAWALLPEESDGRIHLQETIRGRFDAALLGATLLVVVGINRGDGWYGWWNGGELGWFNGLLWFAALAVIVTLVVVAANQRGSQRPPNGGPGRPGGPGGPVGPGPVPPPPGAATSPSYPSTAALPAPDVSTAPVDPAGPSVPYPPTGTPMSAPTTSGPAPQTSYPSGYGSTPPYAYAPVPPVPPAPPKPHVRGPGAGAVGAVVGLTLVALALLLAAERVGTVDLPVGLAAIGIGVVLAGIGIVVAGLRGRSSGTLGFLAITGAVLALPAALYAQSGWSSWSGPSGRVQLVADEAWTPRSTAAAAEGIAVAVGDLAVDLTEVPLGDDTVRVPLRLGGGEITVTVPAGTAVTADVRIAAGDVLWEVDGRESLSGVSGGRSYTFESDEVADGATPQLALDIESGAGQIRIVEES